LGLSGALLGVTLLSCAAAAGAAPQPCFYSPDAYLTVQASPQGYHFGSVTSPDASYSTDCHTPYTVDVTLPGGYSHAYGNFIRLSGGFGSGTVLTEDNCSLATVQLVISRRSRIFGGGWSDWELVSSENVTGSWVPFVDMGYPPYCQLAAGVRVAAPVSVVVTHQYRVNVRPRQGGIYQRARVGWHWSY
jgi:hypothetical protein